MQLYKKALITGIIITSLGLYYIRGLGIVIRMMDIMSILLIAGSLVLFMLYGRRESPAKMSFGMPVILIIAGVLVSSFSAEYHHDQSLGITLYQQRHMYAFLVYFLLFYLAPKPEWLINLLFYFGIIGGLFYIVQYLLYPTLITDAKIFLDRGTIRMNLPGGFLLNIGFFLSVDRFFTTHKLKYGLGALLLFLVAILSGFRSVLALYVLLTTAYLLINKQIKNKLALLGLYSLIVTSGIFAFQGILTEMKESAERESAQGTSYIRYRAAEHFISMNQYDKLTYIIGNGEPTERSRYGRKLAIISLKYGYYLSDIGIVGLYYKYGLLTSLVVLFIIFRVIFTRSGHRTVFITMFFIYQLLLIFNSSTSFENLSSIIAICIMLYLLDLSAYENYLKNQDKLIHTGNF